MRISNPRPLGTLGAALSRRRLLGIVALGGAGLLGARPRTAAAGRGGGPSTSRAPIPFGTADGVGLRWAVKASAAKVGPGPNLFSDLEGDVWADAAGLHLTIVKKGSRWWCTEVIGEAPLGYGTYRWVVASDLSHLDLSVVLGLFTWDDLPAEAHREVDIEFARWSDASSGYNAQYTVQPWDAPGHRQQFAHTVATVTTHEFVWAPGRVEFRIWSGAGTSGPLLRSWTYSGAGVPTPGGEHPRMNLWLFRGRAPESNQRVHLIMQDFTFTHA
jgi:hypothetical protein